jgi:uncharacterized protein
MTRAERIMSTEEFVRLRTKGIESGHDWWHIDRVRKLALYINDRENLTDPFMLEISSLLHDVADIKFSGSDQPGWTPLVQDPFPLPQSIL